MPKRIDEVITTLNHERFFIDKQIITVSLLEKQGHCNQNYLLHTTQALYLLRLFGEEQRDRALEYRLQQLAFLHALAPEPYLLDLDAGFMVSAYSSGIHKQALSEPQLQALAKCLSVLHRIPIQKEQIPSHEILRHPDASTYEPVLCHHDLNPYNILWQGNTPTLIDWEYSSINDRYFDLASIVVEFHLDQPMSNLFLESYFQDTAIMNDSKLSAYKRHYQKLCAQWWQEKCPLGGR